VLVQRPQRITGFAVQSSHSSRRAGIL
jgi:hypothetical protein